MASTPPRRIGQINQHAFHSDAVGIHIAHLDSSD